MSAALQLEQAFRALEQAPERTRALVRPVLLRALRDRDLLADLGPRGLSAELSLLSEVLSESQHSHASAMRRERAGVERAEAADRFVAGLDSILAGRVRTAMERSLTHSRASVDLLTLARLLAHAFADPAFIEHVQRGATLETFAPELSPLRRHASSRG